MLPPGFQLGQYRIERLLGRGAMGAVYQGVCVLDGGTVAIKTVHSDLLAGKEQEAVRARFRQEAAIGIRLRHPFIIQVHSYGEQNDLLYLAMDFVEGQELGHWVTRTPPPPLVAKLALILQLLNALSCVHRNGVVHRDIKPANILVRQDHRIALTDFGVAHLRDSELTQTGELLGSPLYMAPEQLRGDGVDGRSDLFATGVVLYLMLTGRKPFVADSLAALMHKVLHEEPLAPSLVNPEIPTVFDAVLRRALAKEPSQRFSTAAEFAAALRSARAESLETQRTDLVTVPVSPNPLGPASSRQAKSLPPSTADFLQSLTALLEQCINEGATESRIAQLAKHLPQIRVLFRDEDPQRESTRQQVHNWRAAWPLTALTQRIQQDAPLPGRSLGGARGDWLGLVRVFSLLWETEHSMGDTVHLDRFRNQIIQEWTRAFLDYAGVLHQRLLSPEGTPLAPITADLMRLELLQLALEELQASQEVQGVRATLQLFAEQIVSRVNTLLRQLLHSTDPLASFDIVNLLVEVEEWIALAHRLLDPSGRSAPGFPGGSTMTEFVEHVRKLAEQLTRQLLYRLHQEQHLPLENAPNVLQASQTAFLGRLQQLGLLYRFVVYWRSDLGEAATAVQQLAVEMHQRLTEITENLYAMLEKAIHSGWPTATVELLWARLTVIADLAEQLGWPELHQRILHTARRWVQQKL